MILVMVMEVVLYWAGAELSGPPASASRVLALCATTTWHRSF